MSHVLLVVARRYNGHELWTTLGILKQRGHTFEVVSTDYVMQDEITSRASRIKRLVKEVEPDEIGKTFNALMIVSGNRTDTERYWDMPRVLSFVRAANTLNLPIAAICCSVPTVRDAAEGKKVSFYPLVSSRDLLRNAGAVLTNVAMTRDQNLVTAEHQMATQVWAEEFCNLLEGKPVEHTFIESNYTPHGQPSMPNPHVEDLRRKLGRPPTKIIHDKKREQWNARQPNLRADDPG